MSLNRRAVIIAAEQVRAVRLSLRACLFAVVMVAGMILASQLAAADGDDASEKAPTPSNQLVKPSSDDTEPSGSEPSVPEPSEPESDDTSAPADPVDKGGRHDAEQPDDATSGTSAANTRRTPSEKAAKKPESPSAQDDSGTRVQNSQRADRDRTAVRKARPAPDLTPTKVIPRTTAGIDKTATRLTTTVDTVAAPAQKRVLDKSGLGTGVQRATDAVDTVTRTAISAIDRTGDGTNERVVRPVEEIIKRTTDPIEDGIRQPLPGGLELPELVRPARPEPGETPPSGSHGSAPQEQAAPTRRTAAPRAPTTADVQPPAPAATSSKLASASMRPADRFDVLDEIPQTTESAAGSEAQKSSSAAGTSGGNNAPGTGDAGIASSGGAAGISAVIQADVRNDMTEQVTVRTDAPPAGRLGIPRQPGFSPD